MFFPSRYAPSAAYPPASLCCSRHSTLLTHAVQLRAGLQVLEDEELIVERYSDSAGAYVTLDADKPQIYKTLFRAAKAKLKLRLRAHVPGDQFEPPMPPPPAAAPAAAPAAIPAANDSFRMSAETLTPHAVAPVAPVSPLIVRSPDAPKFEAVSPVSPPQPEDAKDEAPVPQSFTARQSRFLIRLNMTCLLTR
jgi:next-to-BRCA1 protein 1